MKNTRDRGINTNTFSTKADSRCGRSARSRARRALASGVAGMLGWAVPDAYAQRYDAALTLSRSVSADAILRAGANALAPEDGIAIVGDAGNVHDMNGPRARASGPNSFAIGGNALAAGTD
ncbi:adhesin, partial [Burkholderia multivorans]